MGKFKDLTGMKIGRLLVLGFADRRGNKNLLYWHCQCDCGQKVDVSGNSLRSGSVKSCGCYQHECRVSRMSKIATTHGLSKTREYTIWGKMKARCYNKNDTAYLNYGGRGIKICERWKNSFLSFFKDMGNCPVGFSIERIDNDGDYEPDNCKWASHKEQSNNRRSNIKIAAYGEIKSLKEWSEVLNIPEFRLYRRYACGVSMDKLLSTDDLRFNSHMAVN